MTIKRTMIAMIAAMTAFGAGGARAADEIVIAVGGPMTGREATFGDQMQRGAALAVADLNAAGGLLGKTVRLEVGDDACDPKQAVAVANKFANAGVIFAAGHFCSSSSIPASAVYHEENILQISPGSTNPKLTEQGFATTFRVCGRDDQQGAVAGTLLAGKYAKANIAIIHDKSAYGKGLADETKKALNAAGVQEKLYEGYTKGEKDYSALVSKLKENGITVLYVGGYHTEAGLIARQLKDQGMTVQIISGDALVTNEYWAVTGDAGEGTLMTFGPEPRNKPEAAAVVAKFRAGGYEPEGYTLYTYAAIQVFAEAVRATQSTDRAKLIKELRSRDFSTVIGTFGFDAKGDVTTPAYVWYQWKGGQYAELSAP